MAHPSKFRAGRLTRFLSSMDAEVEAMTILYYQPCRARHCCFGDISRSHLHLDRDVGLAGGSRQLSLVALPARYARFLASLWRPQNKPRRDDAQSTSGDHPTLVRAFTQMFNHKRQ